MGGNVSTQLFPISNGPETTFIVIIKSDDLCYRVMTDSLIRVLFPYLWISVFPLKDEGTPFFKLTLQEWYEDSEC